MGRNDDGAFNHLKLALQTTRKTPGNTRRRLYINILNWFEHKFVGRYRKHFFGCFLINDVNKPSCIVNRIRCCYFIYVFMCDDGQFRWHRYEWEFSLIKNLKREYFVFGQQFNSLCDGYLEYKMDIFVANIHYNAMLRVCIAIPKCESL